VGQASWPVCLVIYYPCVLTYYERNLPHWQPEGAALFVTWRLHGSLPGTVEILGNEPAAKTFAGMDRELDRVATGPRWLQDERVSDFVVAAVQEAAQKTITDIEIIRLSREAQDQFVDLLLNPPQPAPALKRAFERHRAMFGE
jgi:hypothetical protein